MDNDAIIIGGSFAGLAAATYIARARRKVTVIDAGLPRNRFAAAAHGFLSRDNTRPAEILAAARSQTLAYPTADLIAGSAARVTREDGGFSVQLADGRALTGRRLVLAYGLTDHLPDIPGLAERWGRSVIHCPYCHGFEFSGMRLGVLRTAPMSVHQAQLIPEWGPTTYYLNGGEAPEPDALANLQRRGVRIEAAPIAALEGEGTGLSTIRFADGRSEALDALYVGPRASANSDLAVQLGCDHEETFWGQMIRTDEMQATTVPGVFAAGDIARAGHSVTFAAADGVMAGTALHRSLVF